MSKPIDNDIRKLAVSEQDKNIVVTAGAGTGKTTLLVDRILHLLLGHKRLQKEESPIPRMVAMTFTEKAASEMKIRLMQELEKIVSFINGHTSQEEGKKTEELLSDIRDFYQTTPGEVVRRAKKSLEDIDKAIIGTIHSFAAYILRLYPIESGVVPGFIVDEGDLFDELFDKEWTKWLEKELALNSPHANIWKYVLKRTDIESLKELTKQLSGFTIPLDSLMAKMGNKSVIDHPHPNPPPSRERESGNRGSHVLPSPGVMGLGGGGAALLHPPHIQSLADPLTNKINEVVSSCEKPNNNLLTQLHELSKILESVKKQGIGYLNTLEYDLDKNPSEARTGWTYDGFSAAQELVKESHTLLKKLRTVDEAFVTTTIGLILPFAKGFRQTYLSQGYVSFDGLLTLTRDLLQNKAYRHIREKLKNEFMAILVDEFQDTDPIQYEIVLFLSEALGHYSKDARNVTLEPGKLFIVGDPKQSIYAFRRADIEAYEQVVKQVCDHDKTLKLQENFRSHAGIIEVVNQLFDGRIMIEQPGLQPRYVPIHANRHKEHPSQKVEVVLVSDKEGEKLKADEAREAEAEWIVRWITKHVDKEGIEDTLPGNEPRKLKYRDVALLLRAFTQVRPYVEALKRYGIPYIVEGEKYFYTTQEILDFTNLLRIIENPHDTIALVGVLRSPIAGLTDREIYELKENHLLDYRKSISDETSMSRRDTKEIETNSPESPFIKGELENLSSDVKKITEPFYDFLRKFHVRSGTIPVSQLITEIIENTHIAEITACAWHGEQKLANLWKLYQMACDMEQSEGISLKTFIERIKARIKEAKEEGESPLSDETLDVVKILSIHKSKGLEFPVVILGNLHGEVRNDNEELDLAVFDWTTSTTGIVIGKGNQQVRNFQSIVIEKKLNDRSWEEEKRVLYVAMTRAKERLILTGALKDDDKSYMGLITKSVRDTAGIELGDERFMSQRLTKEDGSLSPSPNPSHQGRGNAGDLPSGEENITSGENKTDKEESPLPLRERVRVRGISKGKFPLRNAEVFVEHFRFDGTHHPLKPSKEKEMDIDWTSFVETWKKRREAMVAATQTSPFTSPSAISRKEAIPGEPPAILSEVEKATEVSLSHAAIVGSICHRVLEGWDFQGTKEELERSVESAIKWELTIEKINDTELIKTEVIKILSNFIGSEAHKELQDAQILGREVPILLNWDGQIMRGTIDILYKIVDRIIIADYKTDHVKTNELSVKAANYNYQRDVYIEAVKRSLKIDNPEFKLIFLRIGKTLSI
ncbi:MAG TPA: UvrD-helicase domain-containing protein [Candidatus Wunengus sp. YC60]|uniref:UvrD-helicase domain-containing protein n=1 Tax=Candidatus Wunengus sp. YC60 TaxID=3367697 RepID=UPI004026EFFF